MKGRGVDGNRYFVYLTPMNLNNIHMNVIETAGNGVVNHKTIFRFTQKEQTVTAEYAGGQVVKGFLLGKLKGDKLSFKYAQEHTDGKVVGGQSTCEVMRHPDGALGLVEHFDWHQGRGKNVFKELV